MSEQITAVVELDQAKYKTKIFSDGHFIYADEPAELGGTDEGMNPNALLLASLGSCTAITIRMYADRKAFPLTAIKIELTLTPSTTDNSSDISRKIELVGDLDESMRKRLMIIADKCPIHKMLTHTIRIHSSMA